MAVYDQNSPSVYDYYGQHSVRLYYGVYTTKNVSYRIDNNTQIVKDETEKYYDTWKTFHLIPAERPIISVPKPNTKMIKIPGKKDPLDFSTYLTGHVNFGNRSGGWTFYTDADYIEQNGGPIAYESNLRNKIHGRIFKVMLTDDPGYFYVGQLTIGPINPGANRSTVSISYNFYPYKKAMYSSMDLWKFDDFDFSDSVIQYMKDMEVTGSRVVDIYGSRERISPHISGTSGLLIDKKEGSAWVSYGSVPTESIEKPDTIIPRLVIGEGITQLRFRGNGTVTIDYRRGLL